MVEMRYVWRDEPCGENVCRRVKVLQYRNRFTYESPTGVEWKHGEWSEWIDVPVVEDP